MNSYQQQKIVKTHQYDTIFIRHAQSNFNKGYFTYVQQNQVYDMTWLDLVENEHFNKIVTYNPIYIDSHITQHGIIQCQKAKQLFNPNQIDLVLVSPQLRALQTCKQIFGQQKNVIIHPLVTQVFRYSCDVSNQMQDKRKLFPFYNFQQMKNWNDQWYIEVISEQKKQICREYFQKKGLITHKQRQLGAIELLSKKIIAETAQQLRQRVNKLKQLILEMKNKHKANKVAVISHHYTTQCLLSPGFDQNHEVKGIGTIENGRPYFRKLDDILKVK